MENLNQSIINGLLMFLELKPIAFIQEHSMLVGIVAGVISLVPFMIARIMHVVIVIITTFAFMYVADKANLDLVDVLYFNKAMFMANFVGNYIFGCMIGFVVANAIQRIRGEHDHVNHN